MIPTTSSEVVGATDTHQILAAILSAFVLMACTFVFLVGLMVGHFWWPLIVGVLVAFAVLFIPKSSRL